MNDRFAHRMTNVQKSFIREILQVTENPEVISFAGGLPNPSTFPVTAVAAATARVLAHDGPSALQYAPTLGFLPLREWIAGRYGEKQGLEVHPDEIMITNGSQQGLDLVAKILLDPGDGVLLESPSYLGGIQAFALYEPRFVTVPLREDGVETAVLAQHIAEYNPKLFYALPNFQNPTGISYSAAVRQEAGHILANSHTYLVEDDPYSELHFSGEHLPSLANTSRHNAFLLGSFSKIVSPGMRMGWICAPEPLMEKLIIAKQAADLHSNFFSQRIIYQFLQDNDLETHLNRIRQAYKLRRDLMLEMIAELFPAEVTYTQPDGGMFLWLTLPETFSSMDLFHQAVQENVVFVPGLPFYVNGGGQNNMRLNYSNCDPAQIETGMTRLATAVKRFMSTE